MSISSNNEYTIINNIQWESFVAGVAGGIVPIVIFHPLELVKIRYQVNEFNRIKFFNKIENTKQQLIISDRPMYKNLFDSFLQVYKQENGVRGLYRGLNINIFASGSAWGIYFLIYNTLKSNRSNTSSSSSTMSDMSKLNAASIFNYFIDATLAGTLTIFITNPLFLIKTRMCLQYNSNYNSNISNTNELHKSIKQQQQQQPHKYKNSFDAFKNVIQQDGLKGLYRGILPGLFGTLNGTIQMVTYDLIKLIWFNLNSDKRSNYDHDKLERRRDTLKRESSESLDDELLLTNKIDNEQFYKKQVKELNSYYNSFDYLIIAGLSKCLAVVCTYPFQLIRSRSQDQHRQYTSIKDICLRTYRQEGLLAFYKGLIPCLLRVTPAASITFIVYENLLKFL